MKPDAGVSVSVESSTLATTLALDEVAVKVIAWVKEESVANSDTVFATFLRVACSFIELKVSELSTAAGAAAAAAGVEEPPPHEERKKSKEHAATNLSILIPMFISLRSNVVYFGLFIFYKILNFIQKKFIITQKINLKII